MFWGRSGPFWAQKRTGLVAGPVCSDEVGEKGGVWGGGKAGGGWAGGLMQNARRLGDGGRSEYCGFGALRVRSTAVSEYCGQ